MDREFSGRDCGEHPLKRDGESLPTLLEPCVMTRNAVVCIVQETYHFDAVASWLDWRNCTGRRQIPSRKLAQRSCSF